MYSGYMNQLKQKYEFVGNNLGVDFVNTEVNVRGELVDLLLSESDVMQWLGQANIDVDLARGIDVGKLLSFRKEARQLLSQIIEKQPIENEVIERLNTYLQNYRVQYRLEHTDTDYQLIRQPLCESTGDIIGLLAYELANLLVSEQRAYLKRCLNPDCVLMFVDNSRSHKRRWCSMETCGNRAKASKHYRKVKS